VGGPRRIQLCPLSFGGSQMTEGDGKKIGALLFSSLYLSNMDAFLRIHVIEGITYLLFMTVGFQRCPFLGLIADREGGTFVSSGLERE